MNNIDQIIWQVLADKADKKDVDQLNQWLEQSDKNRQIFDVIKTNWNKRTKEPELINEDEVFDKVWQKGMGDSGERINKKLSKFLKIAASFLILITIGYFISTYDYSMDEITQTSKSMVTKENPAGQKSKLFLPDGTIIWLNAESSVYYQDDFTDSVRLIQLTGEAYFEVAKDSLRPFIVQTENVFTEAIGTSFNINSYNENEHININLVSGKVQVNSNGLKERIILKPGEAVRYNRQNQKIDKYHFEVSDIIAWKDGILIFEDASYSHVVQKLKRWYGVDIESVGTPKNNWQFSGRFYNEYLANVLEVMQYNRDFQYELKNKHLKIIF